MAVSIETRVSTAEREARRREGNARRPTTSDYVVTVYALVHPDWSDLLGRCAAYIQATGYGKRKSVGYGAIRELTMEPFEGFGEVDGQNGFVTLSNFVPAAGDPTRGFWSTLVKRGKLAEDYANLVDAFKRPVVMLTAGSCFYDDPVRPWYGRMVGGVHPDLPQVVQYGFALSVGIQLPGPKRE